MVILLVIMGAILFLLALIAVGVFGIKSRLDAIVQLLGNSSAAPETPEAKPHFQLTPTHDLDDRR